LFWEKISEKIYKRFNLKINYIFMILLIIIFGIIITLLNF